MWVDDRGYRFRDIGYCGESVEGWACGVRLVSISPCEEKISARNLRKSTTVHPKITF